MSLLSILHPFSEARGHDPIRIAPGTRASTVGSERLDTARALPSVPDPLQTFGAVVESKMLGYLHALICQDRDAQPPSNAPARFIARDRTRVRRRLKRDTGYLRSLAYCSSIEVDCWGRNAPDGYISYCSKLPFQLARHHRTSCFCNLWLNFSNSNNTADLVHDCTFISDSALGCDRRIAVNLRKMSKLSRAGISNFTWEAGVGHQKRHGGLAIF